MPDIKELCLNAAKAAASMGESDELRSIILSSTDGLALTSITCNAPTILLPSDIETVLASFPWVMHVQPCTVSKWQHPCSNKALPMAAIVVDCYSLSGRWQMLIQVGDDSVMLPLEFREILAIHPLSSWSFPNAENVAEANWAQRAYLKRESPEQNKLAVLQAQIEQNNLRISDLTNGRTLDLSFAPIVAFDLEKHSVAPHLEALGRLALGLTNPIELLSALEKSVSTLRQAHCEQLLEQLRRKVPKAKAASLAELLKQPPSQLLELIAPFRGLPEALGLAYWGASFDHDVAGISFGQLAKALNLSAKNFEIGLGLAPLEFTNACPVCAVNSRYKIHRLSPRGKLITFSMHCANCSHEEAYHRTDNWLEGQMSCNCPPCVDYQRAATREHLPRVVIALEDALRDAFGLAANSLRDMTSKIETARDTLGLPNHAPDTPMALSEWNDKHSVYLQVEHDDTPAPLHGFLATVNLGVARGGTQEEAIQAVTSLGPTSCQLFGFRDRPNESVSERFRLLPNCMHLLLEGDSLLPSELLLEWSKSLRADGLLHGDRSMFAKLVLGPGAWLSYEFSSERQNELELKGDLVVSREVPNAEVVLRSLIAAVREAGEPPDSYQAAVASAGHASAPMHGELLLQRARTIPVPEAQVVLQQLAEGQQVSLNTLRAAREALKGTPEAAALLYAALMWNYSSQGTGKAKASLGPTKLAVFPSTTVSNARTNYSITVPYSCRRCSNSSASLNFGGATDTQAYWRVDCSVCGHFDESHTNIYYFPLYCDCQHCANATSVALNGRSTASLVSEIISHCVMEAHALSSQPTSSVISEESDIGKLFDGLKYHEERAKFVAQNAHKASWKTLRPSTTAGMLRQILPGYSFDMPSMEALALITENRSPTMSRAVFQAIQKIPPLLEHMYRNTPVRFRLPLCAVLPPTINEPKLAKRTSRKSRKALE